MAKDIVKETQARIQELKDKKKAELEHIDNEMKLAIQEVEAANKEMQAAMEVTDSEAYGEAKKKLLEARDKREMYSGRYQQLKACEYLTETESDRVIDALREHEEEIATAYEDQVKEILRDLRAVHEKYKKARMETENTIDTWTREIHANYRSFGLTSYLDEATGLRTDRSPRPLPVNHKKSPIMGRIKTFLENMDAWPNN